MKEKYQQIKVKARELLNRYENIVITFGVAFMVLGIFFIENRNNELSDENKFIAEIWGTVSDWYMVIVTTLTAIFLYKTLKSQKNVQKEQTRLFKIEELKYLNSIKPKVNLNISRISKFDNNDVLTHLELTINLSIEKAKNINHKVFTSNSSSPIKEGYGEILGSKYYVIRLPNSGTSPTFPSLLIEMKYTDCDGNKYLFKKELLYLADRIDNIYPLIMHESENLIEPMY